MNDISFELAKLHLLTGADFIRQLKLITSYGSFRPIENHKDIFSAGGEKGEDYENLLNAAKKAVEHGYQVFILPNPKGINKEPQIMALYLIGVVSIWSCSLAGNLPG